MMKRGIKFAIAWLVFVALPVPLIVILNTQLVDMTSTLIVYNFGVVAYVWWLVSIILATRPSWLERLYGLPTLYFFHGFLALLALILATFHKFLAFSMFPLIRQTGNIAWYLELFLMVYAVLFLSGWLVDRFKLFAYLKHWLEQHGIYHQVTIWIHRLNWVVVALIWLHVHLIPRVNVPGFRLTFDIYTLVAIVCYVIWKLRQGTASKGTVISNQPIGASVQAVTIKLPLNQKVSAGDFYFLAFQVPGLSKEWHPFSVAEVNGQKVTLMIHRRGDFTRQVELVPVGAKGQA